jgi:NTP pyrophosphatase (non-canonical NTP hydrolase)
MGLSYPKNSIFVKAVEACGTDSQINMMIEECAELITALQHSKRKSRNSTPELKKISHDNIIEELADVEIVLRQMVYIFGIDDFEKKYADKITRLEEKLNKRKR